MEILIVEDDLLLALELQSSLREAGHEVVGLAPTLPAALRLGKAKRPRIALVDIYLGPRPDGLIVASELARCGVLVILLTGSADSVPPGFQSAIGLVQKPCDVEDLLDVLEFVIVAAKGGDPTPSPPRRMRLFPVVSPKLDGLHVHAGAR